MDVLFGRSPIRGRHVAIKCMADNEEQRHRCHTATLMPSQVLPVVACIRMASLPTSRCHGRQPGSSDPYDRAGDCSLPLLD